MKEGCLSKLTITESTHQAIQYNKVIDALSVFCIDKVYQLLNNIICTNTELIKAAFLPPYLNSTRWSNTYHVQINTINPNVVVANGAHPIISEMVEKDSRFQRKPSVAIIIGL